MNVEPVYQTFTIQDGNIEVLSTYVTTETQNCVKGNDVQVSNGKFTALLEPSSITTFCLN
jgi:O-glycosyl hydrolase